MRTITVQIPDKEHTFFLKLIKQLGFVAIASNESVDATNDEFLNGLKEAVEEVKLARKGKIKLKTAEELLNEL